MHDVITDINQVTPTWLTEVLQTTDTLPQGHVVTIEHQGLHPTLVSAIARLEVRYSADAPSSAPRHFFLKMTRPEALSDDLTALGWKEVTFYTTLAPAMGEPPTVICYDAVYSSATHQFHLLLADLSLTHDQTEWPLPPSEAHCTQSVECLAHFHAHWWDHPRLGTDIGSRPIEAVLQEEFGDLRERCQAFLDFLGDRLSRPRRTRYEQVLEGLPSLWKHRLAQAHLTIVHNDAHVWNFLYPRDPSRDTACLIDWQLWELGSGVSDLAYMMALHWYPERRAALEQPLLRHYHRCLQDRGVQMYDWEACWRDYQLAVLSLLVIPAWQWSAKLPAGIWWSHLERAMLAFEDLGCAALLET